jgi:hypothetical protein
MRFNRGSRRLRVFAIALASVSVLAVGTWAGLASAGVAASADDPTVPETTTPAPTPDPAPAPQPAPAPKPKPAPRPVVHSTPHVTHTAPTPASTPTYTPPTPSVTHTSTPTAVRPHVVKRAKPKRHKAKHVSTAQNQPRVSIKPRIGQTLAEKATKLSPVASVGTPTNSRITGLIAGMFAVAILLFGIGATPARFIPSGRVAYQLVTRRVEITLFGLGLLVIALLEIALTRS